MTGLSGWVIKQIAGAFGGYILVAAVAAVLAVGATGGYAARGLQDHIEVADAHTATANAKADLSACVAAKETVRADANAQVAMDFAQSINEASRLADQLEELSKARDADTANFLKRLRDAPQTKACASSPAFQLLFDRMRHDTAGTAKATGN